MKTITMKFKNYLNRLLEHPGLGYACVFGIFQVIVLIQNECFVFIKHYLLIPVVFTCPWLMIVLITNCMEE
jgi:antibiotic biosynthesis monooxygenase (ABM) superfamily enzyme